MAADNFLRKPRRRADTDRVAECAPPEAGRTAGPPAEYAYGSRVEAAWHIRKNRFSFIGDRGMIKNCGREGITLLSYLKRDPVLAASAVAAAVSMVLVPPSEDYWAYLDLRTLGLLLSLMLVVAGLRQAGFFDAVIHRLLSVVRDTRSLTLTLVGACFFSSMLITNDVSLLTFVPLAALLLEQTGQRRLMVPVIVLQTIAANLGSMLTPMGNPQNLYLYARSGMGVWAFLKLMAPASLLSLALLTAASLLLSGRETLRPPVYEGACRGAGRWLALFGVCLLTVARALPWGVTLAAVLAFAALTDRTLLRRADYGLLLTFVFFFIFIGNLKRLPAVSGALSGLITGHELSAGVLLSQVISNVPAAMLLSGFTERYDALLLGVNIGGLGTPIASMASLISYKLYLQTAEAEPGKYLGRFTVWNLLFLAVLWTAALWM